MRPETFSALFVVVFVVVFMVFMFLVAAITDTNSGLQPAATVPMGALPSSIPSQLGPVRVVLVHNLVCDGDRAIGCFTGSKRLLEISADVPLVVQWQGLEHERFHMVIWDAGLQGKMVDEDVIADAVASNRITQYMSEHALR